MENMNILTNRLKIVEFDDSMAEIVHINSLDEDNRKFVPDEVFETVQEAHDTIMFLIECYKGKNGPFVYPILLKSGEIIGHIQAVPLNEGWEVGYHIAEGYTRNGYATEVLIDFLPIIMKRIGLEEIWGICRADNIASRKVLEKCFFSLKDTGIGIYHGQNLELCKYIFRR